MEKEWKYIRFFNGIVVFPKSEIHSEVAKRLEPLMNRVISAGFTDGELFYGESISLRVKAREDDADAWEEQGHRDSP